MRSFWLSVGWSLSTLCACGGSGVDPKGSADGSGDALRGYGSDSGEDVASSTTFDAAAPDLDAPGKAATDAADVTVDAGGGDGASARSEAGLEVGDAGEGTDAASEMGSDSASGTEAGTTTSPVVLFGGQTFSTTASAVVGDTWLWNGAGWIQKNVTGPSPRLWPGMATVAGTTLLFGGLDHSTGIAMGDTWLWDGSTWRQQNVAGPSPRVETQVAALNGQVVLFGGGGLTLLGDTWLWDGTSWTQLDIPGPPPRTLAAVATLNGKVVLFGGAGSSSSLADTWEFDGTTWTERNVSGPSDRAGAAAATLNGKVVLFGGAGNGFQGDTWLWDGATWTQANVSGPLPRYHHGMATLDGKVVLYGGTTPLSATNSTGVLGDTWLWDGATWTQDNLPGPPARTVFGMCGPSP